MDIETLTKGFDDSLESLRAFLGGDAQALNKATKAGDAKTPPKKVPEVEIEDDPEEEEMEYKAGEKPVTKSLETEIMDDLEASASMDVEPFLKSLVTALDNQLHAVREEISLLTKENSSLRKSVKGLIGLSKASSGVLVNASEFIKSTNSMVNQIGGQPVPSNSLIKSGGAERFNKNPEQPVYDMHTVMTKAIELNKSQKLTALDVTKIEGRLSKGMALEPHYQALLFPETGQAAV